MMSLIYEIFILSFCFVRKIKKFVIIEDVFKVWFMWEKMKNMI